MAPTPTVVHLPNGHNVTVVPVFGGYFFKANELTVHNSVFPAGWTVIIHSEDYYDTHNWPADAQENEPNDIPKERRRHIHPFKRPTLQNDSLFISSISNPSSTEFKSPSSPSRQIAMMLWVSLYWYFHLPEPTLHSTTEASQRTPEEGKPKGEWRINIKREGVFRGRNLIQKLERMGLVMSEDSAVGLNPEDNAADGWCDMFMSRRAFWQIPSRLFLFTLSPVNGSSFPGSPYGSRPNSPVYGDRNHSPQKRESVEITSQPGLWSPTLPGPYASGSHLPTYFPPHPLQYTVSSGIRHPRRQKPPRQGEIFYIRYIPSVGQYLSFRTASLSTRPLPYTGPIPYGAPYSLSPSNAHHPRTSLSSLPAHISATSLSEPKAPVTSSETEDTTQMTDLQLLHKWMNIDRVSKFWGCSGPENNQAEFLRTNLTSNHSFPAIGMWDGKPFGYFELYWVKEDILGKLLGDKANDFDRGVHVLVGEDEFRGKHRVKAWMTSLAHWAFSQDYRTNAVVLEPRVDNTRFISTLNEMGFLKHGEITFPHKQSAFVKLTRDNFEAPQL